MLSQLGVPVKGRIFGCEQNKAFYKNKCYTLTGEDFSCLMKMFQRRRVRAFAGQLNEGLLLQNKAQDLNWIKIAKV